LQSGPVSGHRSFQVIEATASRLDASPATPRRRWSTSAKEEIVAKAMMPGVNVSALARAHGLSPQQVFGWRRKALADARARTHGPAFAVVTVEAEEETEAGDTVELVIGEVTVRLGPDVTPARITAIVRAIRAA
jgi:transposase